MRTLSTLSAILIGFALSAVLFTGLGTVFSEEEAREAPSAVERSHAGLVGRVKRAASSDKPGHEFQLVVVATEAGFYVENYGNLEPEDAALIGLKLHALGDLVGAPAELEELIEELEEHGEHEDADEEEEEHEDDDDDDEDHDEDDDDLDEEPLR